MIIIDRGRLLLFMFIITIFPEKNTARHFYNFHNPQSSLLTMIHHIAGCGRGPSVSLALRGGAAGRGLRHPGAQGRRRGAD